MSDQKITELTELSAPDTSDLLPIVDIGATETKKITVNSLIGYAGTLLSRTLVGAGGVASIDLSSIPATYDYIEIIIQGKSENVAQEYDRVKITFNNDTTDANYREVCYFIGDSSGSGAENNRLVGWIGTLKDVKDIGSFNLVIPNYAGSFYKDCNYKCTSRQVDSQWIIIGSLTWKNTSAINRITLTTVTGSDFAEGTLCIIVGYKNS